MLFFILSARVSGVLGGGWRVEIRCFYLQGIFALKKKVAISPERMASIYENTGCHIKEACRFNGYEYLCESTVHH
jgi:hypothetical protein